MANTHIAETIVVALDFDGVIGIGEKTKIKYAKILQGIDVNSAQITKDTYPLGKIKYDELMEQVCTKHTLEFEIASNCKKILEKLFAENFRFVIVTSRKDNQIQQTKDFCKLHKLPIKFFHNTNNETKEHLCRRIHASAIIDDSLHKIEELKQVPILGFYLKTNWNAHISTNDKDYINIESWTEFYNHLISMKEMHEAICFANKIKNNLYNSELIYNMWKENPLKCKGWYKDYQKRR